MPELDDFEESLFGPGGPVAAAQEWMAIVLGDRDLARAWALTDPELRLVFAQEWLMGTGRASEERRDDVAAALGECPSSHPLWGQFVRERGDRLAAAWADFEATWSIVALHDPVGPGLELVWFVPPGQEQAAEAGEEGVWVLGRRVLMHLDGGWLVRGLEGRRIVQPGWPPYEQPL